MPLNVYATGASGRVIQGRIDLARATWLDPDNTVIKRAEILPEGYPKQPNNVSGWYPAVCAVIMNKEFRAFLKEAEGKFDIQINYGLDKKHGRGSYENTFSWHYPDGTILELLIKTTPFSAIHHQRRKAAGMPYNPYPKDTPKYDEYKAKEAAWKANQSKDKE